MSNEYFVVIEHDVESQNIEVLHITNDYTNAIKIFHDCYNIYVSDDMYIVREVDNSFMRIYQRNIGMIWSSKSLIKSFKLCKCYQRSNIVSE